MRADLTKRQRILASGQVSGVRLENDLAGEVLAGIQKAITLADEVDTGDRTFALVDDTHILAFVQLAAPVEADGGFLYEVESVESMTPALHALDAADVGPFLDGVTV